MYIYIDVLVYVSLLQVISLFQGPKRRCQVSYAGKAGEAIHAADDLPAAGIATEQWDFCTKLATRTLLSLTSKVSSLFSSKLQNLSPQTMFFLLGSAQLNPPTNFQLGVCTPKEAATAFPTIHHGPWALVSSTLTPEPCASL